MWKPSSLHISSMAVFSLSTCPSMTLRPFGASIFDDHLHEQVAETASLEVGAHQDGVFAVLVVGVGMEADHPEQLSRARLDGDEGHGAGVVDLGETRDEGVAELLHRREEPQPQVLLRDRGEERPIQGLVFRAHRTHDNSGSVA